MTADAPNPDQILPDPDRRIDAAVHGRFREFVLDLNSGPCAAGIPIPHYSTSLDAVIDLAAYLLPGWIYQVANGALADNVRLMPDVSHPEHGVAFRNRWPHESVWLDRGPGLEAVFAPSPRGAMALLAVLLEVLDAVEVDRQPDPNVPAARRFFAEAIEARALPYRQSA